MTNKRSQELFNNAQRYIPGGVNSPVRAFKSVGGDPIFIKSAKGAYLYDVDENRYIDMINSWGPMILGHANEEIEAAVHAAISNSLSFGAPTEAEVEMGELISRIVPSVEKVRMVNSGTEATMSAIRLARGFTGRNKFVKFEGCYHGHGDSFLIAAGSGAATLGIPDSPGVTKGTAQDTITLPYNNLESVQDYMNNFGNETAAIILEPVVGNMGCVPPADGYLEGLRELCDQYGTLLIFDEVMTGFRLALGGAQELYNITPDLTTMGKIIGGGMPVGAYGGRSEIMELLAPVGPVYQAGTLSGNPVAMSAGITMLKYLESHQEIYSELSARTGYIAAGIRKNIADLGLDFTVNQVGSMISLFFTDRQVRDFTDAKTSNLEHFTTYFKGMLSRGIYLAPSQYESLFLSTAIDTDMADYIIESNFTVLKEMTNN